MPPVPLTPGMPHFEGISPDRKSHWELPAWEIHVRDLPPSPSNASSTDFEILSPEGPGCSDADATAIPRFPDPSLPVWLAAVSALAQGMASPCEGPPGETRDPTGLCPGHGRLTNTERPLIRPLPPPASECDRTRFRRSRTPRCFHGYGTGSSQVLAPPFGAVSSSM